MKLGPAAFITLYSRQQNEAKIFYDTLGFSTLSTEEGSVRMTDGNLLFDLRSAHTDATLLSYCTNDIPNAVEMAANLEIPVREQSAHHAILEEPNGLFILLAGPDMISPTAMEKKPSSLCGTFYEISLETSDMERSIVWWQNVGFKATTRKETWCTLDDGKIMIGLYQKGSCPHRFKNPSLTYFETDMAERIQMLKSRGIKFIQEEREIGMEGHAIAESPDGQFFFLFKA